MKKQTVNKLVTSLQRMAGHFDSVTMHLAGVIVQAIDSGETEYLDAIAHAFNETLAKKEPRLVADAIKYVQIATGCEYDSEHNIFHGTPEHGEIELADGSIKLQFEGMPKPLRVHWYQITDTIEKYKAAKRDQAKRERAKNKPEPVDFAKTVTTAANRVRKDNPIGATLLDTVAKLSPAEQATVLRMLATVDAEMPAPMAAVESKSA